MRTVLAYVLSGLVVWGIVGPVLSQELTGQIPEQVIRYIGASVAIAGALQAAITRVMATQTVDQHLSAVGLGAQPRP